MADGDITLSQSDLDSVGATPLNPAAGGGQRSPGATVAGVANIPPTAAVSGLTHGPGVGVPPSLAMLNPQPVVDMVASRRNQAILQNSQPIASWAAGDPAKVAATQDDFPALASIGEKINAFPIIGDLIRPGVEAAKEMAGQFHTAMDSTLPDTERDVAADRANSAFHSLLLSPLTGLVNTFSAPLSRSLSYIPGAIKPGQTQAQAADEINQGLNFLGSVVLPLGGFAKSGAAGDAAAFTHTPEGFPKEPGPINYDNAHPVTPEGHVVGPNGKPVEFNSQVEAAQWILKKGYADPTNPQIFDLDNGAKEGTWYVKQTGLSGATADMPPPGVSDPVDTARAATASSDAESMAALEGEVAASKTQGRMPALTADFVNQTAPDKSVWVNPEKALEIYQDQGVNPGPDDGILGHIPGFQSDLQNALSSGQDIQLPLGDYLAAVSGKPWADQLRDGVRFREDGVSVDEGKTLGASPEVSIKPAELPADITPEEHDRAVALAGAAGQALSQAVKSRYLNQLFADAKSAGMTEGQFKLYSDRIEGAVGAAQDKLLSRAYDQIRRERTPAWKEAFAQNKASAEQDLFSRPDIQAMHYLRYSQHPDGSPVERPFKLDRASIEKSYPGELTNRLPDGIFGNKGISADAAAETFGYDSGDQMLRELVQLEDAAKAAGIDSPRDYLKQVLNGRAHQMTGEELGFDITPDSINAAAQEAVTSPEVEGLLSDELRALAKHAGLALDKDVVKAEASRLFSEMLVKDAMNLKAFERAIGMKGRAAEVALLKSRYLEAFRAKQQQLLNHLMLQEAHGLVKDFAKTQKKFQRWAKKPNIKSVAQEYLNYVHDELSKLGYNVKRNARELASQINGVSLDKFIADKTADGKIIQSGSWSQNPLPKMKVEEYRAVRDTLSSLIHNGRVDEGVVIAGKRQALADVIARVKANADKLGRKLTPERIEKVGLLPATGHVARFFNAPMIRPEQLLDEADINDPLGPLNEAVIYPLQAAKGRENDLQTWATKEFKDLSKTQPKEWLGSMNTKIEVPTLRWTNPNTGLTERRFVTKGQIVRMMLNLGNKVNQTKLLEGYNWELSDVMNAVDKFATKADWDFVQKVWDMHEHMWPEIERTYRNLSGVAPAKRVAVPIQTKFGTYAGGYFPIVYDMLRAPSTPTFSKDSLWGEEYSPGLPSNNYTKGVTNHVAPISLNFAGLNSVLGQTIHDVAFREALGQASRVVLHPDVQAAIQDNFGPAYKDQLRPWLEYVARERVFDERAAEGLANMMAGLRSNLTFMGLAYRASSAMIHFTVAQSDSIGEVGAPAYFGALRDLYASPKQHDYWMDYVTKNSPEIRNRLVNMDQNVREAVERLAVKQGFLDQIQKFGYHMLAYSDNLSAIPTWMAAAKEEIAKGRSPEEAFQIADKRVRQAHGSSAPVDLPALQRAGHSFFGEVGKSTAGMFLSFMNHNYNRIWGITKQVRAGADKAKAGDWAGAGRDWAQSSAKTFWYVFMAAAGVTGIRTYLKTGNPVPHSLGDWADGILHATFGGLPAAGILLEHLEGKESESPIEQFLTNNVKTVKNLWFALHGRDYKVSKRWIEQAANSAGGWTGKVPGQAGTTGQYIWDYATGAEHPKDFNQFIRGLLAGPAPKGKK